MNKKFVLITSSLLLATLAFGLASFRHVEKSEASVGNYSTNAATYYNGITATSGQKLAAQLHDLITNTHRTYTAYDDNGKYKYQQQTDQYYENGSKVSGYIYEFYSGVKWPNGWYPDAGDTRGGYNREHCWCQSNSVNTAGKEMWGTNGGGADMHHLRPVESRLNSTRNNHPYGEIDDRDNYKSYAKYGNDETYALGGYTSTTADTFEPLDSKKGDVARIILYTYLHYNSYTVSTLFGSYGTTNGNGQSSFFSTSLLSLTKITNQNTEAKALEMLLRWNTNDPVDDIERRRNEQVAIYQGNRNPFIDNSSYADAIWGTTGITSISKTTATITTGSTTTISAIASNGGTISWSSSNTNKVTVSSATAASGSSITLTGIAVGSATITASITISGTTYSKTCTVTVTGPRTLSSISLSGQTTAFTVDDSFIFDGTVTANYTNSTTADVTTSTTFSGYDMSTTGDQTITASYTEGGTTKTATYTITISDPPTEDTDEGSVTASNGAFEGWTASGTGSAYADGSAKFDSSGDLVYILDLFEGNVSANMTSLVVTINGKVNVQSGSPGSSNTYKVEAIAKNGNNIVSKANDTKTGSSVFNTSPTTVDFEMSSGLSGTTGIRITYVTKDSGNWAIKSISWVATYDLPSGPVLSSITLDTTDVQKSFVVNETFNYDNIIVTAVYDDESTEQLDSFDVSTPDMSTTGNKTITVTYETESATYQITVTAAVPTSITATPKKTFYVGETLTVSNITVEDNYGNEVENFTFTNNNYQFLYSDATSGGSLTNKTFTNSVSWNNLTCSLTVQVQRKARYDASGTVDVLTQSTTGVTTTTYTAFSGLDKTKTGITSDSVYAGQCAGGNSSIQLRSAKDKNNNYSGIITTTSGGSFTEISVVWNENTANGRYITIYGKNSTYSSANDLYSATSSTQGTSLGTITYGTSTSLIISGNYSYIGIRASEPLYLTSISITCGVKDTPLNMANYIMYTDTANQCTTKFDIAKGYFDKLSTEEKATFMTSNDYVIATARERFEAWARNQGKTITLVNGTYTISNAKYLGIEVLNSSFDNSTLIVIIVSFMSVTTLGVYLYRRKKKNG